MSAVEMGLGQSDVQRANLLVSIRLSLVHTKVTKEEKKLVHTKVLKMLSKKKCSKCSSHSGMKNKRPYYEENNGKNKSS
jgi:hypothetical protein